MNKLSSEKTFTLLLLLLPFTISATDLPTMLERAQSLYRHGKIEESITAHKKLVRLYPQSLLAIYNLGFVLRKAGYVHEAIPFIEKVVTRNPSFAQAHISLAQAYLTVGNYLEGWAELEWRLGKRPKDVQLLKKYIQLRGTLTGKTVLLRSEWGLGDTIQLIRYAQKLKKLGATVVATIRKPLVNLLSLCPYIDTVIGPDSTIPPFHFEIPMVSLPVVFETTLQTVPDNTPYLNADTQLVETWKQTVQRENCFNIGICWKGNVIHTDTKFMPLNHFLQLADIPGIQLYSLQQHHGLEQIKKVDATSLTIFDQDFDKTHGGFMDTAAVMKNLDLIITVDTSIAHLAGALGIPVWVILPRIADWRWMLDRNDSPWYPTMRLFRQIEDGIWDDVVQKLKASLKATMICAQLEKKIKASDGNVPCVS